ncbi:hypothetical protein QAD02_023298 [Eretmocerus hayati]|uniref:Uncharacterized protein n=1 Tax=Eretmocerus hayati TaxID=131215 RepID=A0ACC2PV77_9HYME|nr:hypothetical protein QAD02_023298 [Eretmocerus hayati]
MSGLIKALKSHNSINGVTKLLTNLSISPSTSTQHRPSIQKIPTFHRCALLHTTSRNHDLMEFFDEEKNWKRNKVVHGRSWLTDELRIKSNTDLHKLWYVLLKEKNMLLTMEHACNQQYELFPNPERLDKVEESMKNLETVVRERNDAYYKLETGETGEQPAKYVWNILGMRQYYKLRQHVIPRFLNTKWKSKHLFGYNGHAVRKFLRLYREKIFVEKKKHRNREFNQAVATLKKFPNTDLEALQMRYTTVNLEKLLKSNRLKSLRMASRFR